MHDLDIRAVLLAAVIAGVLMGAGAAGLAWLVSNG